MRSLHFSFRCRSPRKGFLPHACGVFPTGAPAKSSDFVGRGAAAERVSFRPLAEANDTQLAATRHAPRNFGTFCPEVRLLAVLPQPGYSFSDGHSVVKMLSIDELP